MEHYKLIRRRHFIDGLSVRAIAGELGHSRETVVKALKHAIPPGHRRSQPANRPVMEPLSAIVEAWLEQDRQRPRRQRHTTRRSGAACGIACLRPARQRHRPRSATGTAATNNPAAFRAAGLKRRQ